VTDKMMLNFL